MNLCTLPLTKAALLFGTALACFLTSNQLSAQVNFNAAAAFSLRKIVPTYTGSAIQVRRSNDNATQNIGFTSCGFLDTAALKTFVTTHSGFISIWYDQSGNARDASQSTAASQPRIVNAGAIEHANGRPTIGWPGANTSGIYLSYGSNVTIRTINAVRDFKLNPFTSSPNNMQYLFSCSANSDFSIRLSSGGTFSYDGDNNGNDWINGSGTPKLCWVNGTQTTTAQYPLHILTASASGTVNGSFSIGSTFLDRDLFNDDAVSELVVYSSTITNTQRTLIETAEAVTYTMTASNSKYSPPTASSYNLFINGIGRESATDSVNATRASIGMGFLCGHTASDFLKDNGDYLTCGINCPITSGEVPANLPATLLQRWNNDWYVHKTDVNSNNGDVTFYFDFSDYAAGATPPGVAANYELLYRSTSTGNFTIVPGTTKSVSGNRVLFKLDASNITTNYYYTIGTKSVSASPLPIELTDFQCSLNSAGKAVLNWGTASEFNSAYFVIERSTNGVDYEEVGRAEGAGNSITARKYTFMDALPLSGLSYYRLKQVDNNGVFKNYDPCAISINGIDGLKIAPNPASDYVDISCPGLNELSLLHVSGKLILHQQFSDKARISTQGLEDGIYLLMIQQNGQTTVKKLIIK